MIAYWLIFVLLLIGGALSLVENGRTRRNAYTAYLCFALPILFLFAGLRAPTIDVDYGLYSSWYQSMVDGSLGQNPFLKDPTFALIGFSLNWLGLGIATLIAIYTAACLGGQLLFVRQAINVRWVSLGMFLILCRFYIPHEMTQIRVSVAAPIASLAVLQFFSGRRRRGSLLLLLAMMFHFSSILVLPLCIAGALGITFQSRRWLAALAALAALGFVAFSRVAFLLALFARTSDYVSGVYDVDAASLLSVYLLCRLVLVGYCGVVLWKRLDAYERRLVICSALGITLEIALASNNALSIRSGEVFGLFDVATALILLQHLQRKAATAYVLFLLCLSGNFYRSSTKIVQPYDSRLAVLLPD